MKTKGTKRRVASFPFCCLQVFLLKFEFCFLQLLYTVVANKIPKKIK